MMESYFVKGLLVALIFGVPAGAVGALTILRTLEKGFLAGFLTGLGSSAVDLIYACVGIFGKKSINRETPSLSVSLPVCFGSAFLIAITNLATIPAFFVAFAAVGISGKLAFGQGAGMAAGILMGNCLWWLFLSGIVCLFRKRISDRIYQGLNKVLGLLMVLFGVAVVVRCFL